MVLEKLGDSLKGTLGKIKNALFVDEKLVNELVKEIQKALLQSDVNVKLVFELTKKIKERALKEEVPGALSKKEWLVNIVYEELTFFLGKEELKINIEEAKKKKSKESMKIMLVGLFGNGKTTTAGKLAHYFQKRGHTAALLSTDTWRPAAFEQLKQLGKRMNIPVYGNPEEKDPVKIYKQFEPELNKVDIAIIDTAGRDALNNELINELDQINKTVHADHSWLVIAADVGQAAEKQARTFHETCNVDGVIITKMDGTAKGGGALIACSITGAKVAFLGVGEKINELEKFKPKNFVGRLLGMGDLEALLEKVQGAISEEDAQDLGKKFLKGEFSLLDLYEQMTAMRKMGPLSKVMEMIPGMGQLKLPKDMLKVQEGKLVKWKYIMDSCTQEELEDPTIISSSRIDRIAKGSGTNPKELRELLKQHKQSKKMVKMMKGMGGGSQKGMERMMKKMQQGGGMPQMKFK